MSCDFHSDMSPDLHRCTRTFRSSCVALADPERDDDCRSLQNRAEIDCVQFNNYKMKTTSPIALLATCDKRGSYKYRLVIQSAQKETNLWGMNVF
jgi:hypothetical protein